MKGTFYGKEYEVIDDPRILQKNPDSKKLEQLGFIPLHLTKRITLWASLDMVFLVYRQGDLFEAEKNVSPNS